MKEDPGRREFLTTSILAAAWTAIAAAPREEGPPTRAFLDAVIAGDEGLVGEALAAYPGLLGARDEAGRSAFALALLHRHRALADRLRERGYLPDLHESALALDWPRFETLAEGSPDLVNRDHPIGGTAMLAAALGGASTQIWRVYRYGGDPDAAPRGALGFTPVRAALEHPDLATAELTAASLLANGADARAPQRDGSSPLHAAASRGSVDLIEMLIRKGADVSARDAAGRTALDLAEEAGRTDAAAMIRSHRTIPRDHSTSRRAYDAEGRPYSLPDLSGFSAWTIGDVVGQAHSDLDAVRRTVERHPDLAHAVATTTEAAVEAGAHMGRPDIVDWLLGRGAPCSLPTAVMRGDLARARGLLAQDPLRIHERGPHDFALLWYPVIGDGRLDLAEMLLAHGAEVERQHWLGTTALHYAALGGQVDLAALLLEHGADPRRVGRKFDPAGQTPRQIAEARGHAELARLLRDREART